MKATGEKVYSTNHYEVWRKAWPTNGRYMQFHVWFYGLVKDQIKENHIGTYPTFDIACAVANKKERS